MKAYNFYKYYIVALISSYNIVLGQELSPKTNSFLSRNGMENIQSKFNLSRLFLIKNNIHVITITLVVDSVRSKNNILKVSYNDSIVNYYNKIGKVVKTKFNHGTESVYYTYDSTGYLTFEKYDQYDANKKLHFYDSIYIFNQYQEKQSLTVEDYYDLVVCYFYSSNKQVEKIYTHNNHRFISGIFTTRTPIRDYPDEDFIDTFAYNSNNYLLDHKRELISTNNKLYTIEHERYQYNDNGDKINMQLMKSNNQIKNEVVYIYDLNNNLIEQMENYSDPVNINVGYADTKFIYDLSNKITDEITSLYDNNSFEKKLQMIYKIHYSYN